MGDKNTLQKGKVRWVIYRENKQWYGYCLEFGVSVFGDTPGDVHRELSSACKGFVDSLRNANKKGEMSKSDVESLLNQKAPALYEQLWARVESKRRSVKSPIQVHERGELVIA